MDGGEGDSGEGELSHSKMMTHLDQYYYDMIQSAVFDALGMRLDQLSISRITFSTIANVYFEIARNFREHPINMVTRCHCCLPALWFRGE